MFSRQATQDQSTRQAVNLSAVSQRKVGHAAVALEDNRPETVQRQANKTGLPDNLKSGMENISGMNLDHVRVHYNSAKPAAVQAHAYAQGSNIHLGSGQEKHLPHELGHVVQQAQGRVAPTTSVAGMAVNDNPALEHEADVMGAKALQLRSLETRAFEESASPRVGTQIQARIFGNKIAQLALAPSVEEMLELKSSLIQLRGTKACWFLSVLSGLHGQKWIHDLFETGAIEIVENTAEHVMWKSGEHGGTVALGSKIRHRPVWQQIIESKITQTLSKAPFLAEATADVPAEQFQHRMQTIGLGRGTRADLGGWVNALLQAIHQGLSVKDFKSSPPSTAFDKNGAIAGRPAPDPNGELISVLTAEKPSHAMSVEGMSETTAGKKFTIYNQQAPSTPRAKYSIKGIQVKSGNNSPPWAGDLNYFNRYDIVRKPELVPRPSEVQLDTPSLQSALVEVGKGEDKKDEDKKDNEGAQPKGVAESPSAPVQLTRTPIQSVVQRITGKEFLALDKTKQEAIRLFATEAGVKRTGFVHWLSGFKTVSAIDKLMKKGIQEEELAPPMTDVGQAEMQVAFIKQLQMDLKDMLELILKKVDHARESNDSEILSFVDLKIGQWLPGKEGLSTFDHISPILRTLSANIDRTSISFLNAIEGGIANAEARNRIVGTTFPGVAGMEPVKAKNAMESATITFARYSKPKGEKRFQQLLPRTVEEIGTFAPRRIWTLMHESTHAILGTSDVKKMSKGAIYSKKIAELSPKGLETQNKGDDYKNADSWTALIFQLYHWLQSHSEKTHQAETDMVKTVQDDKAVV